MAASGPPFGPAVRRTHPGKATPPSLNAKDAGPITPDTWRRGHDSELNCSRRFAFPMGRLTAPRAPRTGAGRRFAFSKKCRTPDRLTPDRPAPDRLTPNRPAPDRLAPDCLTSHHQTMGRLTSTCPNHPPVKSANPAWDAARSPLLSPNVPPAWRRGLMRHQAQEWGGNCWDIPTDRPTDQSKVCRSGRSFLPSRPTTPGGPVSDSRDGPG